MLNRIADNLTGVEEQCTLAQNQLNQQTESQSESVVKFCFQPTWSNNSDLAGVPQNKNNASMQKISLKVTFKILGTKL